MCGSVCVHECVFVCEWTCVCVCMCVSTFNGGSMQYFLSTECNNLNYLSVHVMHACCVKLHSYYLHLNFISFILIIILYYFLLYRESGCTTLLLKPLRLQLVKKALSKLGIDYVEK